jgi:hypothetical protein
LHRPRAREIIVGMMRPKKTEPAMPRVNSGSGVARKRKRSTSGASTNPPPVMEPTFPVTTKPTPARKDRSSATTKPPPQRERSSATTQPAPRKDHTPVESVRPARQRAPSFADVDEVVADLSRDPRRDD